MVVNESNTVQLGSFKRRYDAVLEEAESYAREMGA
jgi:hypothetical protein